MIRVESLWENRSVFGWSCSFSFICGIDFTLSVKPSDKVVLIVFVGISLENYNENVNNHSV